jgi:hypothetical protein
VFFLGTLTLIHYFFFFLSACDKALAATDFSIFVELGLLKILEALDATLDEVIFLPISKKFKKLHS